MLRSHLVTIAVSVLAVVPAKAQPEVTLLERAKAAKQAGKTVEAIRLLEQCLEQNPEQTDCVLQLASALAARALWSARAEDAERAKALYRRFVDLAPNHPSATRVREILSAAEVASRRTRGGPSERQLTETAVVEATALIDALEDRDPAAAIVLCDEVIRVSPHTLWTSAVRQKLERLLVSTPRPEAPPPSTVEAAAEYARGCALEETDLTQARRSFEAAMAKAPTSLVGLKASLRIQVNDQLAERERRRALEARALLLRATKARDPAMARELLTQVVSLDFDGAVGAKAMERLEKLREAELLEQVKAAPAPSETVTLRAGERRVFKLENLEQLFIGDGEVAEFAHLSREEFELIGHEVGTTELVLWRDGRLSTWRLSITR